MDYEGTVTHPLSLRWQQGTGDLHDAELTGDAHELSLGARAALLGPPVPRPALPLNAACTA